MAFLPHTAKRKESYRMAEEGFKIQLGPPSHPSGP
jgi:hypothetical protein